MWERKWIFLFFTCSVILIFPESTISSSSILILNETNFVNISQTLISPNGVFELGFFNPKDSKKWYVGIWFSENFSLSEYVWVANRDDPLFDSPGVFKIADKKLVVQGLDNNQPNPVWNSSITNRKKNIGTTVVVAELMDTGNLVLREIEDSNPDNYLWQSFDFPTHTLLPGMKLDSERYLTSWTNPDEPYSGDFTVKLYDGMLPEIFIWNQMEGGERLHYRSGPWDGVHFSGIPDLGEFQLSSTNHSGRSILYSSPVQCRISLLTVDYIGAFTSFCWNETDKWSILWPELGRACNIYGVCGAYSICDDNKADYCYCPTGFSPKAVPDTDRIDGCVRDRPVGCTGEAKFKPLPQVELQDTMAFVDMSLSLKECRERCTKNCSCTAYGQAFRNGTGCAYWVDELMGLRLRATSYPRDLFYRVDNEALSPAAPPINKVPTDLGRKTLTRALKITGGLVAGIIVLATVLFFLLFRNSITKYRERKRRIKEMQFLLNKGKTNLTFPSETIRDNIEELPLFRFEELVTATNNFDDLTNQLGKGGFGPVYKGTLENGQEIAVKRLSKASGQGVEEFMNEVLLISKLQHVNLVRLLGCCVEGEEKILVYEYMPNKSLHSLLFDPIEKGCLDWKIRFNIIEGICRGLIYLHRDSRLRIIHRDLKAGNILLDERLNPKISDFGMARIFQRDQDQVNTLRVVGTYCYMSPEYAMEGRFSEKSDVFSFGVLLLEIVSGRRNSSFYNDEHCLSLVGYAWNLWNEGNISDMIDEAISEPCYHGEALRCIHVGLLCVQDFAEDRPTMSKVLSMINRDIMDLPSPKQPAFSQQQMASNARSSSQDQNTSYSVNGASITSLQGR